MQNFKINLLNVASPSLSISPSMFLPDRLPASVCLSLSGWLQEHAIQREGMPLSLSLVPLCFSLQTGVILKVIDDQCKLPKKAG